MTEETQRAPSFFHQVICMGADGNEKWRESVRNLVTIAGKTDLVTRYFTGSSYTAAWYLGLMSSGTASASDTLSIHGGWSEIAPYSGNRPAITFGTTSGGSNTANAISFSINATATISGAFIANASSGTSGILYSASSFSVARSVASGDTLTIAPTVSVS